MNQPSEKLNPQQQLIVLVQRISTAKAELRQIQRELASISVAVEQSAALAAMEKWIGKSDKVVQQLLRLNT